MRVDRARKKNDARGKQRPCRGSRSSLLERRQRGKSQRVQHLVLGSRLPVLLDLVALVRKAVGSVCTYIIIVTGGM